MNQVGGNLERILIVDDDHDIRELVADALRGENYRVSELPGPVDFLQQLKSDDPGLVVLDIELGTPNGLELLADMRSSGDNRAVILLTSRGEEHDRIRGLDLGADDYVTKPFSVKELLSRVRAVSRRHQPPEADSKTLRFGALVVDSSKRAVSVNGQELYMTRIEFGVLEYLASHANVAVSRNELLEEVWGSKDQWQDPETVTEHVRRVRAKLSDVGLPDSITTLRGIGYRFDPASS